MSSYEERVAPLERQRARIWSAERMLQEDLELGQDASVSRETLTLLSKRYRLLLSQLSLDDLCRYSTTGAKHVPIWR